ncbi:Protein unc-79-like protein [Armadillidium vulgare]|nr:Protein unc-79-like protein [Armadillidium vulgare]
MGGPTAVKVLLIMEGTKYAKAERVRQPQPQLSVEEPSDNSNTITGSTNSIRLYTTTINNNNNLKIIVFICMECGESLEEFSNEDLGLCIIILSTFVHREAGLAAPLLPRMLKTVSRVAGSEVFNWQYESPIHLPGSATSIGRQFLRCVLHQLAPNQIFNQIFQIDIPEAHKTKLFRTLAQALTDFNELNPSAPIQLFLENLNSQKCLPTENLGHIIGNLAVYMECASQDGNVGLSSVLISLFDTFLRKVLLNVMCIQNCDFLMKLLINIFKIQGIASQKNILDPMSKLLSFAIQNAPLKFEYLCEVCYLCNRILTRERDKFIALPNGCL